MEALKHGPLIGVLIFVIMLICRRLAYISTVPWGPLFPFKPFNCSACLTFWYSLAAFIFGAWQCSEGDDLTFAILAGFGLVLSFINFFYNKSKFKVNE